MCVHKASKQCVQVGKQQLVPHNNSHLDLTQHDGDRNGPPNVLPSWIAQKTPNVVAAMHRPIKGTNSPRARRPPPYTYRIIAFSILVALVVLFVTRRPSLKEPPPPPIFPDVVVDSYLTRLVHTLTTAAWSDLQHGLRDAVLDDARAYMANPTDPAWNHTHQGDASGKAAIAQLWNELRTLVLTEAPGLCTAPMLHPWATRARPHYLFAANLRDAQQVAPHLIRQIVIAVVVLQPHATVSVSIYESGSRDATGVD